MKNLMNWSCEGSRNDYFKVRICVAYSKQESIENRNIVSIEIQ